MARYKYPAPFDQPSGPLPLPLNAPLPPSPPLPVDIPVDKPTTRVLDSLYRDVFGDDLSLVRIALEAHWVTPDQRRLAVDLIDGKKDLNSLSTADRDILDDLVHRYNDYGGDPYEDLSATAREGREVQAPEKDPERGRDDAAVSDAEQEGVHSEVPSDAITNAYGWLDGDSD